MKQYVLDIAGLSDRGVKRDHNEDAWSGPPPGSVSGPARDKGHLYVVADGVGGHQAGDVASKMAVELIQQRYYSDPDLDVTISLPSAIQAASEQIDKEAAARSERRGMSTTVTVAVLRGLELTVANVGDSRTYLIRDGQARQITADHTWVEEQVRVGLITRDEAAKHPQRNIITRSLGSGRELDIDIFEDRVKVGDSVLLCSDGLSNMVTNQEIGDIVSRGRDADTVVHELIELAIQRGAPDNVTAVLLTVVRRAGRGCIRLLITALIFGVMLFAAGGLVLGLVGGTAENDTPTSVAPSTQPDASPDPSAVLTPITTPPPLSVTIPPPELVWPAEDTVLTAGAYITFVWKWEGALEVPNGRFVFTLHAGEETQALVHEEFSLDQRQFVIPEWLGPGGYLWTMSVLGTEARGASAGRLFSVVDPTPTPVETPVPTLVSPG